MNAVCEFIPKHEYNFSHWHMSQDCQGNQEDEETQGYQDWMDSLELEVPKAFVAHLDYQH